jgi:hypothetical protein
MTLSRCSLPCCRVSEITRYSTGPLATAFNRRGHSVQYGSGSDRVQACDLQSGIGHNWFAIGSLIDSFVSAVATAPVLYRVVAQVDCGSYRLGELGVSWRLGRLFTFADYK